MAIYLIIACSKQEEKPIEYQLQPYAVRTNPQVPPFPAWRHPAQDAFQHEGIALHDAQFDGSGKPFALVEEEFHDETGAARQFSGVQTLDVEPMDETQRNAAREKEITNPRQVNTAPKIGEALLQAALAASPEERLSVAMYLKRPPDYVPLVHRLEEAIALGEVQTIEKRYDVRKRLLAEQQALVAREISRAQAAIASAGGAITYACRNLFCLEAQLPAAQIFLLQDEPWLARMDAVEEIDENALRGREISAGTQMLQFQQENYMGDQNAASLGVVRLGVTEHGWYNAAHVGYREMAYPNTLTRIVLNRTCNTVSCTNGTPSAPTDHATAVTGIALGDLTDGQDPLVSNADDRVDRSGFAREAALYFWRAESDGSILKVLDDVTYYDIPVLNMSISAAGDTSCKGESTLSRAVNTLFESGTVTFIASGNNGHDDPADCRVEEPGSAIAAFVVGGHTNSAYTDGETQVRSGPIWVDSDRGGCSWAEGKWRTIIDMTAPACRMWVFNESGGYDQVYTYYKDGEQRTKECATSFAAPTVTGAAVEFIDYYRNERSAAIDDPWILTAHMLLMGDRQSIDQNGNGFKTATGFDNVWGAGRLKMRKFDDAGMDDPWGYATVTTCIGDGNNYYVPDANGMLIPASVDAFKAVLFYYDWRHEQGTSIDRVNLTLQKKNPDGTWSDLITDTGDYDEKKRIFYNHFYNDTYYRIRIQGESVTCDYCLCGTNSMRAVLAYFYEDSARDDADGPNASIDIE